MPRPPSPHRLDPRRALALLAAPLLVALVGGVAAAQGRLIPPVYYLVSAPRLEPGVPLRGELSETDGQNFKDGSRADVLTFSGQAGDAVHLSVVSGDFDAYLSVFAPDGGLEAANDDDEAGTGTDAALDLTLPASGTYLMVVSGYEAADLGGYTALLTLGTAAPSVAAGRALDLPAEASSELTPDMAPLSTPDAGPTGPSESFLVEVTESALLFATATSTDFDTELFVFDEGGTLLSMNDDGDPSTTTDAALALELQPGRYRLVVASYDTEGSGSYTLRARLYRPLE
jgi:hypothetical protein